MQIPWEQIDAMLRHPDFYRLGLFGEPGLSKTHSAVFSLPPIDAFPLYAITITEEMPAAELRGHFVPTGQGEFGWLGGPTLRWWQTGGRLVLDEIDKAGPDVLSLLLCVLNDPNLASLTLPTGETVMPNKAAKFPFQVVATMNGTPEDLPAPLRERLLPLVQVTTPHPTAFDHLPDDLQKAARRGVEADSGRRVALREWQAIGRLVATGMPEEVAYAAVFGYSGTSVLDAVRLMRS